MYDMYPEWGPAAHDPKHPLHQTTLEDVTAPVQQALDLRDNGGERPDDN